MAPKEWIERHGFPLAQIIADHDGWKDELQNARSLLEAAARDFGGAKLYVVQKYPAQGLTTTFFTSNKRFYHTLFPERVWSHANER